MTPEAQSPRLVREFIAGVIVIIGLLLSMLWVRFDALPKLLFHPPGAETSLAFQRLQIQGGQEQIAVDILGQFDKNKPVFVYFFDRRGIDTSIAASLAEKGTVVVPLYPGYYGAAGKPEAARLRDNVDTIMRFILRQGFNQQDVVVLGHTLGVTPAMQAAAQFPQLQKVLLINAWSSVHAQCMQRYVILCGLVGDDSGSLALAPDVHGKIRVFYAEHDTEVPYTQSERLFAALGAPDKRLIMIRGDHTDFAIHEVISAP